MKKRLSAILVGAALAVQLFVPAFVYAADSPSSWAAEEVGEAIAAGIVPGSVTEDYQESITREEFCETALLTYEAISGTEAETGSVSFSDTDNPEILKAANLGIVQGYGNGIFAPDDLITREQIAVMLVRMIDKAVELEDITIYNDNTFPDSELISDWARPSVNFAYDNGIMRGVDSCGSINPLANTSCEEAVLLAYRTSRLYTDMLPQEAFEEVFSVDTQIKESISEYEDDNGYIENIEGAVDAAAETAEELKASGAVEDYSSNNNTVWMQLESGIQYVYVPQAEGVDLGGTDMTITTCQPFDTWYAEERPGSGDHERGTEATDGSAEDIEAAIGEYSFVNNYDDGEVTLNRIKNFGDDQLILWHGHGGYNSEIHSFLCTGEELDETAFLWDPIYYLQNAKHTVDYLSGNIVCTSLGRIAITKKFVDEYISSMNNSFIYLGACESGKDSELANSFLDKGAAAVIGNSDTILTAYNQSMMRSVCEGLLRKDSGSGYNTLSEALDYAFEQNGPTDSLGTYPIIFGDREMRLSDAAGTVFSAEIGEVNGTVYAIRDGIPTCTLLPIETEEYHSISGFAYYDGYVYYIETQQGSSDYSTWLYRCRPNWSERELLSEMICDWEVGSPMGNRQFIIENNILYYGSSGEVTAIDLATMEQSTRHVPSYTFGGITFDGASGDYPRELGIYNDTVFYTDGDHNLYTIDADGSSRLLASDAYIDGGRAGGYLYYAEYNYQNSREAQLCRISLETGEREVVATRMPAGGGGPYFCW